MLSEAILFEKPGTVALAAQRLAAPGPGDCLVEVAVSGVSTGTERLLFSGEMPPFPGLGYPLVPGYEAIGTVIAAGDECGLKVGCRVFAPGSSGFLEAHGLFGAAASHLVTPAKRLTPLPDAMGDEALLLALAATAHHAVADDSQPDVLPDLVVGHGVLGRLATRLVVALGGPAPTVWERSPARRSGGEGYAVVDPGADERRDYRRILDLSGDPAILDAVLPHMARGGTVVLGGFYKAPVSFAFPPAFMREARIRVAAEWTPADMAAVMRLVADGRLALSGLITHTAAPARAETAYRTAFGDPSCLKMTLDWRVSS